MKAYYLRVFSFAVFLEIVEKEYKSHMDDSDRRCEAVFHINDPDLQTKAVDDIRDHRMQTCAVVDQVCGIHVTLKQLPKTMKSLRNRVEEDLEADFARLCSIQVLLGAHTEQKVRSPNITLLISLICMEIRS